MENSKEYFLVIRALSEKEISFLKTQANVITIFDNDNLPKATKTKLEDDYVDVLFDKCFHEVIDFGHKKFQGKSIADWLTFNTNTYWYYLRFSMFNAYFTNYKESKITELLAKKYSLKSFSVYSHSKIENTTCINPEKQKANKNYKAKFSFLLLFLIRFFIGIWQHFKLSKNKNLILLEPNNQQKVIDINDPTKVIYGDYYNEYLTDEALNNQDFIFLSDYYPPKFDTDFKLRKLYYKNKYSKKSLHFEFYYFLSLLNPFNFITLLKLKKQFKENITNIISQNKDTEYNFYLNFIKSKVGLLTYIKSRENAAKLFIKMKKVKTITCHHEYSFNHYSIVNAAKSMNIPTIGFQHGVVHTNHIHYIYSKLDEKYDPLPDKTILWGNSWKKTLIEHSIYTEENTEVLGQTRTDVIPKLKNETRKKTIVYASQLSRIGDEFRKKLAFDFLTLSKKYSEINFLIKPHPGEKDAETFFRAIATEIETTNFELTYDDLYSTLNSCGLLVNYYSTVASEAIYFKKPVIFLDYLNKDISEYSKYIGAVFTAKNIENLEKLIEQFEKGELVVDISKQNEFILNFAHIIDGKASKKYLNYVTKINNEHGGT